MDTILETSPGVKYPVMSWLPDISECKTTEVVCVAGKSPTPEKITSFCMKAECGTGCPNLVPIAMIQLKPDEVIGKRRYQPNLIRPSID